MMYALYRPKDNKIVYFGDKKKSAPGFIAVEAEKITKFSYVEGGKVITPNKTTIKKMKEEKVEKREVKNAINHFKNISLFDIINLTDEEIIEFVNKVRELSGELEKKKMDMDKIKSLITNPQKNESKNGKNN